MSIDFSIINPSDAWWKPSWWQSKAKENVFCPLLCRAYKWSRLLCGLGFLKNESLCAAAASRLGSPSLLGLARASCWSSSFLAQICRPWWTLCSSPSLQWKVSSVLVNSTFFVLFCMRPWLFSCFCLLLLLQFISPSYPLTEFRSLSSSFSLVSCFPTR